MTSPNPQDDLARWLPYRRPDGAPVLRLFCFSYAGGSASAYRTWPKSLPPSVEVSAVQLPGRERRMSETPIVRMDPLVDELARVLAPLLGGDVPFAFFGHSMGGKVAFELTRRLRREGRPLPRLLIVSGSRAPHMPSEDDPIHALPEGEMIEELQRLGGTPQEVLANDELMRLLLPLLRADFELNETYEYIAGEPLDVPVAAYGGVRDEECPPETIEGWREMTEGPFRRRMFEGGHFFLHDVPEAVVDAVRQDLDRWALSGAAAHAG
jgi:medium-chain acyl-[acyl-carrier-protein] hydrolase